MSSNSRTKRRLELMREQSLNAQQQKMQDQRSSSSSSNPSSVPGASPPNVSQLSSSSNFGPKSQPIIINQPIRFAGNRLVHLPPQIIHVQTGQREPSKVLMSSSLPPGFGLQPTPMFSPTDPRGTGPSGYAGSRQHFFYNNREGSPLTQMRTASQASPAELSPDLGPIDSPRSTSFTSAQSEFEVESVGCSLGLDHPDAMFDRVKILDEIIIDEILSLEDDRLKQNEFQTEETSPSRNLVARQISNSAPTSLVDIESLVHQELVREQESLRDRRKKDIHNMIERRRRYNINDRIKELGTLLPKSCTDSIPRDVKLNKGTILKASVDYIRSLQRVTEKIHGFDERQQAIDAENRRMSHRIQELEQLLISNGLPVPPPPPAPATPINASHRSSSSTTTLTSGSSSATLQGLIKQEPPDDDLFGHTGYSPQSDVSSGGSLGGTSFFYSGGDCISPGPQSNQAQQQGQPQQQQQQYYTNMTPVRQQLVQSNSSGGQIPTSNTNSYAQQQYSGQTQDCREPLTVFMGQSSPVGGDVRMQTSSPIQLKSPVSNQSGSYGPRSLPSPFSAMSPTTAMKRHTVGLGSHIQNMGPLPMLKGLPSRATSSTYLVSPGSQNCQPQQQQRQMHQQQQPQQTAPSLCNFNSFGSQGSPSNGTDYGEFLLSDPLISATVNSPEVHWDSGSFSPTGLAPQEVMEQN